MSADDERLSSAEGHFTRRLQEHGLLDAEGKVTELGMAMVPPMQAPYIHIMINKMLSMNRRYQTVLSVVRDVGAHMGAVNTATAMHRLGKLVRNAKAWNPALPERVAARPQYRFLLQRAVEVADELQPRAVANFLWGMAALGDTNNEAVVRRLGRRLMEVAPTELKTQELSNVVWSLVKLDVVWPELWDRMLDSVSGAHGGDAHSLDAVGHRRPGAASFHPPAPLSNAPLRCHVLCACRLWTASTSASPRR
jgi:hypothetical protein